MFTDNLKLNIVGVFVALMVIIAIWHKRKLGYWKRRGVPGLDPTFFFGDMKDLVMKKKPIGEIYKKLYLNLKPKGIRHGGVICFGAAHYVPVDLELVKRIVHTDFQYFHSHGLYYNEHGDPLSANVINLDGSKWKEIRAKLTPSFTSGKIKMMHPIIVACVNVFEEVLEESAKNNPVDVKDMTARFTTDVIGSCAFGLEINSLRNPNAEMRAYGKLMFEPNLTTFFRNFPSFALPHSFLRSINYKMLPQVTAKYFYGVVKSTVDYREKNKIDRKDFLNLLIELKKSGKGELSLDEIAAQSFIFFVAGFETSSTAINFATYELAVNPDIQEKLLAEIKRVLKKYNEELTYDAVMEMTYLDQVIHETLRKYPPLQVLFRKCTKDYFIEEENVLIEKGITVMVPVLGIHYDPEYYPDPDKFDPERFNEENKKNIPHFAYLPFGEGPRICIGLLFGMMQTKMGLISLFRNFKISLNEKTVTPLIFDNKTPILNNEGGIWIDLEKIRTGS